MSLSLLWCSLGKTNRKEKDKDAPQQEERWLVSYFSSEGLTHSFKSVPCVIHISSQIIVPLCQLLKGDQTWHSSAFQAMWYQHDQYSYSQWCVLTQTQSASLKELTGLQTKSGWTSIDRGDLCHTISRYTPSCLKISLAILQLGQMNPDTSNTSNRYRKMSHETLVPFSVDGRNVPVLEFTINE